MVSQTSQFGFSVNHVHKMMERISGVMPRHVERKIVKKEDIQTDYGVDESQPALVKKIYTEPTVRRVGSIVKTGKDQYTVGHELQIRKSKHQAETVDLFLPIPNGIKMKPGQSVKIQHGLSPRKFKEVLGNLKTENDGFDVKKLLPSTEDAPEVITEVQGRGISWVSPSKDLLMIIQKKLPKNHAHKKHLDKILSNKDLLDEAQKNYNVLEILDVFKDIITPKELFENQYNFSNDGHRPTNVAATYTPDTRPNEGEAYATEMRLNIKPASAPALHRLFGEPKSEQSVIQGGPTSHYLYSLQAGDKVVVHVANDLARGPQLPIFCEENEANIEYSDSKNNELNKEFRQKPGRDVLLFEQGNATIKFIPTLEDIKRRRLGQIRQGEDKAGPKENIGATTLVLSFVNEQDILDFEKVLPYLKDGTLEDLHIVCSDSDLKKKLNRKIEAFTLTDENSDWGDKVKTHHGMRVDALFDPENNNIPPEHRLRCLKDADTDETDDKTELRTKPYIMSASGLGFKASIEKIAQDHFGYDVKGKKNIQFTSSGNRTPESQGKTASEALQAKIEIAQEQFSQLKMTLSEADTIQKQDEITDLMQRKSDVDKLMRDKSNLAQKLVYGVIGSGTLAAAPFILGVGGAAGTVGALASAATGLYSLSKAVLN